MRKLPRRVRIRLVVASVCATTALSTFLSVAAPPTRITSAVAPVDDIVAEANSLFTSLEQAVASSDSYQERKDQVRRQALQLAIMAQALADHESESQLKSSASGIRSAALAASKSRSLEDAQKAVARVKEAMEGHAAEDAAASAEWGKLASAGSMMSLLKERSEAVRKALRRPKDPAIESRHAMAMALMILVVHEDTHAVKKPEDKPAWQAACLELQRHMSEAATAIKNKDSSAADHFRMGMEACDQCHQKFKP